MNSAKPGQLTESQVKTIKTGQHPIIACTPEELNRLRHAWKSGKGTSYRIVASRVRRAEKYLKDKISYPPRGGQHNQWYQCEKCEIPLKTESPTRHKCRKCGKVYSGYPYDDVIFARIHNQNLRKMSDAAWAWAVSGDKRFANFAKDILLGYAERYKKYPFHGNTLVNMAYAIYSGGHLFEQTLNEASVMATRIAPAYDLVKASGVLTENEDLKIKEGLLVPMLKNIEKHNAGRNNWQTWHNAGMLWGGAVIHDPQWVERAIYKPDSGFIYQMTASLSKDGMWYEGSWGYHFYAQRAMLITAEGARRLGIDLWSEPQLKKSFTYPLNWQLPGGYLPRFGDSVSPSLRGYGSFCEPAYHVYRDNIFLSFLPKAPSWNSILYGLEVNEKPTHLNVLSTTVFPNTGHAILRSKGKSGLTAAITFGKHGGYHAHYDKLGFIVYAYNRELGVDPGRARSQAYRLPIHKLWYKASISHNVVVVDKKSQKGCTGKLLCFKKGHDFSLILTENYDSYPGVKHKRLLYLSEDYLLVFDRLSSDVPHRYDWVYHNRGTSLKSNPETVPSKPISDYPGMKYLRNIKTGNFNKLLTLLFSDGDVTTRLLSATTIDTKFMTATGPGSSVDERIPMVMITRSGKNALFTSIIEPIWKNAKPKVQDIRFSGDGNNTIQIQTEGKVRNITVTEQTVIIDKLVLPFEKLVK